VIRAVSALICSMWPAVVAFTRQLRRPGRALQESYGPAAWRLLASPATTSAPGARQLSEIQQFLCATTYGGPTSTLFRQGSRQREQAPLRLYPGLEPRRTWKWNFEKVFGGP